MKQHDDDMNAAEAPVAAGLGVVVGSVDASKVVYHFYIAPKDPPPQPENEGMPNPPQRVISLARGDGTYETKTFPDVNRLQVVTFEHTYQLAPGTWEFYTATGTVQDTGAQVSTSTQVAADNPVIRPAAQSIDVDHENQASWEGFYSIDVTMNPTRALTLEMDWGDGTEPEYYSIPQGTGIHTVETNHTFALSAWMADLVEEYYQRATVMETGGGCTSYTWRQM